MIRTCVLPSKDESKVKFLPYSDVTFPIALIVFSRSNFLYQKVTNPAPASPPDFRPNSLAFSSVIRAKRVFNKALDMVTSPNFSARTSYSTYLLSALLARTLTLTLSFSERASKPEIVSWSSLNEWISVGRPFWDDLPTAKMIVLSDFVLLCDTITAQLLQRKNELDSVTLPIRAPIVTKAVWTFHTQKDITCYTSRHPPLSNVTRPCYRSFLTSIGDSSGSLELSVQLESYTAVVLGVSCEGVVGDIVLVNT